MVLERAYGILDNLLEGYGVQGGPRGLGLRSRVSVCQAM